MLQLWRAQVFHAGNMKHVITQKYSANLVIYSKHFYN